MDTKDSVSTVLYILYALVALFWLPAYVLIARRGFIEKTYGMPIVAMMGNWTWEWIYGLGLDGSCLAVWKACPGNLIQAANFMSAFLDIFIVYTVFKFGREKVKNPFFQKHFHTVLVLGIAAAFALQWAFVTEVGFPNQHGLPVDGAVPLYFHGDEGGTYSGFIMTFIMGVLFIQMITERNSLEGQSFIIALFMLMGNVAAYIFVLVIKTDSTLISVLFYLTLIVNLIYAVMTYRKSIELRINPWTRW